MKHPTHGILYLVNLVLKWLKIVSEITTVINITLKVQDDIEIQSIKNVCQLRRKLGTQLTI